VHIAIFAYDHMTALDAVGPYEILSRLPGAETIVVGEQRGPVRCDTRSLALVVDATLDDVTTPDVLVVPGWSGSTQENLLRAGPVQDWLCAVDRHTTWTTSVGTGAIVLAAAGLLTGRRATTHWLSVDWLAELGAVPASARVVRDGKYVTAAGVSAGVDMGPSSPPRSQTSRPPRRSSSSWNTTRSPRSTAAQWTRRQPRSSRPCAPCASSSSTEPRRRDSHAH
jgi:putative intracellular protease/amidase